MGPIALRGENHTVPVLQEIVYKDMIFMIFPFMLGGFDQPWFYDLGEILDAIEQVLQGVSFCHDRLIAHLNLDVPINFTGVLRQNRGPRLSLANPFRKYFPCRVFLNDFELAVCLEEDSDPATLLVTGLPLMGILAGEYGRKAAPEMLTETSYCPLRADVWQAGRMFMRICDHLRDVCPLMLELLDDMTAEVARA